MATLFGVASRLGILELIHISELDQNSLLLHLKCLFSSKVETLESQGSANAGNAKSEDCSPEPCEIDRLIQMIRTREDEIFNLQKILAALTRKHGL
ncbi:hypothetical protein AXF42_Ash008457 [Apostasia shenzhenica]|uniref:Uncharacterized protein n=1 Tax=Apostasia shenzhenica TaxID=1088818 RepID=A0A2I0AXX1_9ASPA|nr:hypothetical protein AXF42_Ash008457 [Apostasia shenzhenica]